MKHIIPAVLFASASLTAGAQAQLTSGIDLKNLDNSVRPADDFYQYACGGWMKNNPLPAAYSRFGSFDQLGLDNNKRVNTILSDLLKKEYPQGTTERKLSDFYKLAMDSVRRNKEGVKPVMPLINEIERPRPWLTSARCSLNMLHSAMECLWASDLELMKRTPQ